MKNLNRKKSLLILSLLTISNSFLYGDEMFDKKYESWKENVSREGRRRSGERIELGSYTNVIKTLNEEYNKKHGTSLIDISNEALKSSKNIKIPIITNVTYLFSNPNKYGGIDGDFLYSEKGKINWEKLKNEGINALTDEQKSKVRRLETLYSRRVYLGDGNTIKDFKILSPKIYKKELEKEEKNNSILVSSQGRYENIGTKIKNFPEDSIDIGSMKEYYKNVVSAPTNEKLIYLQNKIKKQLNKIKNNDIDILIKNNKLYSINNKTKEEYPIDMTFSPYIVPTTSKYFPDEEIVASRVLIYFPSTEIKTGENDAIVYTKDGSIYIEDAKFTGENLRIVSGQNDNSKDGDKLSEVDVNPNTKWDPKTKDTQLSRLRLETMAKKIQFNGRGRIEGDIDLGLGENRILLEPPTSGEFGTSIILGPYVNIRNVNTFEVGSMDTRYTNSKYESFGERQPLTLDIDPNIKNHDGEYDQNAFKTREAKLRVFDDTFTLNNKPATFNIEVMASRLSNDGIININLPTEQKHISSLTGKEIVSNIKFDSDSFVHEIKEQANKVDGTTNIHIKIKNSLPELNNEENKLFKSIKESGNLGELSDTLSYVNKKTIFSKSKKEESLSELKLLTNQMLNKNIYTRLNYISKNQMDVYKDIGLSSLDKKIDLKKDYINGGYLSHRNVEDDFKGNINAGYGVYEKPIDEKLRIGGILGGGISNHQEIKSDNLNTVTTDSKTTSQSIYLGTYINYALNKNINILNGIGLQHSEYKTTRNLKNNYQNFNYNSKSDIDNFNVYSGILYNYSLPNNLVLNLKGLMSYNLINQKSINEDKGTLALNVNQKYYNYLNSELGVGLSKTLYGKEIKSTLSGTIYGIYNIYDTKNNLTGKIVDSSSTFKINGKKYDSESVKLVLNYDVEKNSGITYGIKGEYLTNSNIDNIGIGIKAGYLF